MSLDDIESEEINSVSKSSWQVEKIYATNPKMATLKE